MDKNYKLFSEAWFFPEGNIEVSSVHFKECLMFFEGIDEKAVFCFFEEGFISFFENEMFVFVVFKKKGVIFIFNVCLIDLVVLIDESQL